MLPTILRQPVERLPIDELKRTILCIGHHAGAAAGGAFVSPWNNCFKYCDVVAVVPDRKDQANAAGSLWEYDESDWRINLVPELAANHRLPLRRLNLYPGKKFNEELLALIKETRAQFILSCTFRGIFRAEVIEAVDGNAVNLHPTGIPRTRDGRAILAWPQPLFEGKKAVARMMEMNRRFRDGESELNCSEMEWVAHRIDPPPLVDQGRFLIASRYPIDLPHEEQRERDERKQFNGVQNFCSGPLSIFLHEIAGHLFRGEDAPWEDPRALKLPINLPDPDAPTLPTDSKPRKAEATPATPEEKEPARRKKKKKKKRKRN